MAFTRILFCATFLFTATAVFAESLAFQRAIRLAFSHSTEIGIAQADVKRAAAAYLETHSAYIPQLVLGSNAGYAYGFPLSLEGSVPEVPFECAHPASKQAQEAAATARAP